MGTVGIWAGDTGLLTLESLSIRAFEAPEAAEPDIEWAGSEDGFTDWYSGFLGPPFDPGRFDLVGSGSTLRVSTADSIGLGYPLTYVSATRPYPLTHAWAPAMPFAGDRLLRCTLEARSEDVNRSPLLHVAAFAVNPGGLGNRPIL